MLFPFGQKLRLVQLQGGSDISIKNTQYDSAHWKKAQICYNGDDSTCASVLFARVGECALSPDAGHRQTPAVCPHCPRPVVVSDYIPSTLNTTPKELRNTYMNRICWSTSASCG